MTDGVREDGVQGPGPEDRYADQPVDQSMVEDPAGSGDTAEGESETDATPPDNSLGVPPPSV